MGFDKIESFWRRKECDEDPPGREAARSRAANVDLDRLMEQFSGLKGSRVQADP